MGLIHAKPRLWTLDEYFDLAKTGVLRERTELLGGVIVAMAAQQTPHIGGIALCDETCKSLYGKTHWVLVQTTLRLPPWSAPDPDIVLIGRDRWQPGQPVTRADLIIEVADSSLAYDRDEKASLYAKAGIADYWILNLQNRRLEVHRGPEPRAGTCYEAAYAEIKVFGPDDQVAPLFRPEVHVSVSALLPPPTEQP